MRDPRPDLRDDSYLYTKLLQVAETEAAAGRAPLILLGHLHGFRCQGTRIKKKGSKCVLFPEFGPNRWKSQVDYSQCKAKYLLPYAKEIVYLLDLLAQHLQEIERRAAT